MALKLDDGDISKGKTAVTKKTANPKGRATSATTKKTIASGVRKLANRRGAGQRPRQSLLLQSERLQNGGKGRPRTLTMRRAMLVIMKTTMARTRSSIIR